MKKAEGIPSTMNSDMTIQCLSRDEFLPKENKDLKIQKSKKEIYSTRMTLIEF
jgi:hypothetical protein